MYSLNYVRPATLSEAVAFLLEHPDAKPLSGGMTLIPTLKQRLSAPSHVVDLTRLEELRGIGFSNGVLRIGATTKHAETAASPLVQDKCPALARLAGLIADPQVRNRGTMGGSVSNNDPAADYPAALLGLRAIVVTTKRRIVADDFFTGMFSTALQEGELVVAIEFPCIRQANYEKRRQAASGYAVVGVFVARLAEETRVAVTGAGASVFRWFEAEAALQRQFDVEALTGLKMQTGDLPDDANASAAYRANLVEVYTRRAVLGVPG